MTAPWVDEPMLALDTETTGVDCWSDRIVEVAAVEVLPDGSVREAFTAVVDPGVDIPTEASDIHGITTERARAEGCQPAVALHAVARRLFAHGHRPVVMFNARFDWPLLIAEAERHGVDFPCIAPVLDPYLIDRMVDRDRRGKRRLVMVAQHYGVELTDDDAHGALADAVAAARIMRALLERHPEIGAKSLASVYVRQVRGAERDRVSFADWMRINVDPQFESAPGWPIPTDGVPAPLQVVHDEVSGEAGDREAPDGRGVVSTSPDVPAVGAVEGPGSSAGPVGEVVAGAEEQPAATEPAVVTVQAVARLAKDVLRPWRDEVPGRTVKDRETLLRHAVTFAAVQRRSLTECDGRDLHRIYQRLVDVRAGRMVVAVQDDGVAFEYPAAGGSGVVVAWAQIEATAVVA